ncbi:hypothetical protein GCM10011409_39480 [Lentibacillus populi]|uniref:Uncharacterized protein n=1 Tax=Lentibacillus populi TaxID=1827502 RepID=A0A9W5U1H6_9BACI|nr:hypothetical protein [Lentibacillus populi]GGB58079.1 hypothetical protein GCM10011409_39480 [Lentibacillus populi]
MRIKAIVNVVYGRGDTSLESINSDKSGDKGKSVIEVDGNNESSISFDPNAPFDSPGDIVSRGTDANAFYSTSKKVVNDFSIEKYKTEGKRNVKYKVYNPEQIGISKSNKGRKTKTFDKSYIDAEIKRGNTPKIAQYVKTSTGAIQALKSKAGWFGVGVTTAENIHNNIEDGESTLTIIGDAGVDVGLGATSLAIGGAVSAAVVGTLGAPIILGAVAGLGISVGASYLLDGVKINGKTISEGIKDGVKKVGDGIKKGIKSIAGWFK